MSNATASIRPAILVTGATGKIGGQVARRLLAKGKHIAVASRDPSQLDELVAASEGRAEARRLDLEDPSTFGAFEGIHTAFLVGPTGPDFGERAAVAIEAAVKAGVQHIVRYSALGADPESANSPLARQHGLGERAVEQSGVAWTILRPTFYQDNLVTYQGGAIKGTNAFYGASGEGRSAYVHSADIAEVAAEVLASPSAHEGQRYTLTGPAALTDAEVAAQITEAVGRPVAYVDVGDEGVAKSLRDAGTPEWFVKSMVVLEQVKRNGWASQVSPDIEKVLGRAPRPISAFLAEHADALR